jgi:hypothetical protein
MSETFNNIKILLSELSEEKNPERRKSILRKITKLHKKSIEKRKKIRRKNDLS